MISPVYGFPQKGLMFGVSTWSFSLPVCNAAQSEDDSALILLNNLQQRQEDHIHISDKENSGFCFSSHCADYWVHSPSHKTRWWWGKGQLWRCPREWPKPNQHIPKTLSVQLEKKIQVSVLLRLIHCETSKAHMKKHSLHLEDLNPSGL